ncbi:MAG: HlyD family type I secretion periplasmic adaptor subunit [Alphaproteobacteria bacterium]|nr:HlyD family type I secretion periplasmic adaptor subunit [Alphaproteobacteria bacterium]
MTISQIPSGARKDAAFAPVRLGAQLDRPPAMGFILIMGVALFLGVALLWAHWAVLDEVTTGQGRVIPSSQVQVVQNLEGGIVREIRVREGEIVKKGQVLLQIENTAFVASYGELRAKHLGLMAAVARLKAEAHQVPLEFPPELMKESPKIAERERSLYEARQNELKAQLAVFEQQAAQRKQELTELQSRQSHLTKTVSLIDEELRITKPLMDQGVVPRIEYIRLQRQLSEQQRELDGVRLAKPRARSAMREANRRIQERFLGFKAEAQRDLTARQTELSAVQEAIVAARDRVQRTEVRSPVRGIIKQVKVSTVGGVVRPSADLVEIVPLDDTLLVEAKVRPQDIAFIRPQQGATVKITAYDFSIYGGLKAKVERISADAITEPDSSGREESYYKIIVRTQRNYLGTKATPLPIIPGMVASVDILTGNKSVLDYLLKPVLKAKDRALRER